MADAVMSAELLGEVHQECIAGVAAGDKKMGGERDVGGAHGPDMKIMDRLDARLFFEKGVYGGGIKTRRHGVK